MAEPVGHFTEDELQSPNYRLRNNENEPKRLKIIVFSNIQPVTEQTDKFDKRTQDYDGANRDVDYRYLKENFINRFPSSIEQDDYFKLYQNKNEHEIFEKLKNLNADSNLEFYDCFFFIFLTFCSDGDSSKIHSNREIVPFEKILEKVSDVPGMNGKPKIFLVQADDLKLMNAQMKTKGGTPFETIPHKIPTDADRLIITSTIPACYDKENKGATQGDPSIPAKGFVARPGDDPSFLIQAFVETFNENESGLDLLSMSVEINNRVARLIETSRKSKTTEEELKLPWDQLQLPCVTSTLRKFLFL